VKSSGAAIRAAPGGRNVLRSVAAFRRRTCT